MQHSYYEVWLMLILKVQNVKTCFFTLALGGSLRSISCATWSSFTYKNLAEIAEIPQHVAQNLAKSPPPLKKKTIFQLRASFVMAANSGNRP